MPPVDETASIDLEANLAKAASLGLNDADDDATLDLEAGLLDGDKKPSAAELRASLSGRDREEGETDDLAPLEDDEEDEPEEQDDEPEQDDEDEPAGPVSDEVLLKELQKRFAGKGVDVSKFTTTEAAVEGFANLYQKLGQRDQLAEYGRQILENPEGVFEHLAKALGKETPAKAPKIEEQIADLPQAPEWNEDWLNLVRRDDKGNLVAIEGADPSIPLKIEKFQTFMQSRLREIARDPAKLLKPAVSKDVEGLVDKKVKEILAARDAEQQKTAAVRSEYEAAAAVLSEEQRWVFVDGDKNKGLSDAGKIFKEFIDYAEQPIFPGGPPRIPDVRDRRDFAKAKTYERLTILQKRDDKPTREKKQDKAGRKPNRAAGKANRGGWVKGESLEAALSRVLSSGSANE